MVIFVEYSLVNPRIIDLCGFSVLILRNMVNSGDPRRNPADSVVVGEESLFPGRRLAHVICRRESDTERERESSNVLRAAVDR